jgi:hypothetical protein
MKIKLLDPALPYSFTQRFHGKGPGNLLELVRPDPELERSKGVLENILRWEEDGGKIIEINHSTLDQKRKTPNE